MSGRAEAARARAASPKRLATGGADEAAVPKKMCVEADALADLAGAYADMEVDTPTCAGGDDGTTASTSGSASFCSGASVGSAASSGNLLFFGGSAATQSSSSSAAATFAACKRKRPSMPCGEGTQGQGQQDTVLLGSGKQRSTGPEGSGKKLYLCEEDGCSAFVASRGRCDGCSWRRETIPRVWL